jgi:hypothetical protein
MKKKCKPAFLHRWHYNHYFSGKLTLDTELTATEEEVRNALNRDHGRDNWIPTSLKRGSKVKAK